MVTHEMVQEFVNGLTKEMQAVMEEGWGSDYEVMVKFLGTWYESMPGSGGVQPSPAVMVVTHVEWLVPRVETGFTDGGAFQLDVNVNLEDQTLVLQGHTYSGIMGELMDLQADLEMLGTEICKYFGLECITIQANEEWGINESTVPT